MAIRALIIRPFGTREGIDFDAVEKRLIVPALQAHGIHAGTTQEIAKAGNIRVDMFERLLLDDLVIADISIHNANVFYELGLRHALRDRRTILIRSRVPDANGQKRDVPFDLRTDRYVEYSYHDPAAGVTALIEAVKQTLESNKSDSPVYQLLPDLQPHAVSEFRPVPREFRAVVDRSAALRDFAMLGLLGEEVGGLPWELPARRLVARALMDSGRFRAARTVLKGMLADQTGDVEVNLLLATLEQRTGDLSASTAAVKRVLESDSASLSNVRAEAHALAGSNWKAQWIRTWESKPELVDRQRTALCSPLLSEALESYGHAFLEDQNHFYSGVNTLALHTLITELARLPHARVAWNHTFESDKSANDKLTEIENARSVLVEAVRKSLEAREYRITREGIRDVWLDLSVADHALAIGRQPAFVASRYQRAQERAARDGRTPEEVRREFPTESAARQVRIFRQLGIHPAQADAALEALGAAPIARVPDFVRPTVLVFTGHRIDDPGRRPSRFPAEKEVCARRAILEEVEAQKRLARGSLLGVAGGASGGDILFHEVCGELSIKTELLLALPRDMFAARSVQGSGGNWMRRFRELVERLPTRVLSETDSLPSWLRDKPDYDIWTRNNLWTLHTALAHEDANVSLIALWNGESGDGPGGTQNLVDVAAARGAEIRILDTNQIFGP